MFSRIGNLIYRSSESKNSGSYVNRQTLNLTLDPSGTDFIEYSTDSAYFTEAHSLIPNPDSQITTTALKLQDSATPANNLFLSTLGDFTLCVKHKLNASSTSTDIFSHYFANPQYDISFAEPYIRENSPFNVIVSKASNGPVEYEVSGNLIASDLSSGDISGTLSTVEDVLPFTLNTGTGGHDFVFSLKNLDVSLNAPIYSQYYVTTSTNILGETVFAFSPTGTEGTYNNQLDLSFGANSKMIFNVSDDTMTDISLVFGTTVDDINTRNESVVTRTNDLVILDISAGYDGDPLVYFEDSSAGMGYVAPSSAGGTLKNYTVDVSNGVFRLDSGDGNGFADKPEIEFKNNSGTVYIFDQSHTSNANNTLIIGTAPDISSSIVSSGLTIMGTPGQPGAYTHYVSDGSTVYYFSYQTENMGEEPPMYTVKVVDHEVTGEKVFSFKAPGGTFINQPDLSFGAGDRYQFDVADDTMTDISLVFGTTVDDINTRNESVVSRYEGMILLDISAGYDGDRLVYFEDSSAGMGYVAASSGIDSGNSSDAVINISFDTDGTNSGSYGSSGDMTITHDTINTANAKYGNGALYINSSASGYAQNNISTVFSSIPQNWCISLWMKASTFTTANHDICVMKTNNIRLKLAFNKDSVVYVFTKRNDGTNEFDLFDLPIDLNVFDNAYHHYFFKFEGQTLTTYIDGQTLSSQFTSIASITFERTLQGTSMTNLTIGSKTTTNSPETYYDDLRIFDKIVSIEEAKKEFIITTIENYTVDVSNNSIFRLDSGDGNGFVEKPAIEFANNSGTTYIFDQSDSSNANNTLVIGTTFDDPTSIVSSGLTIMGTPGQPGAYTKYVSDGSTVHYFSYQTSNMGYNPTP